MHLVHTWQCVVSARDNVSWSHEAEWLFGQAAHRAGELAGGNDERRARCQGGWASLWRTRFQCILQQANASVLQAATSPGLPPCRPDTGPYGTAAWETACGAELFCVGWGFDPGIVGSGPKFFLTTMKLIYFLKLVSVKILLKMNAHQKAKQKTYLDVHNKNSFTIIHREWRYELFETKCF